MDTTGGYDGNGTTDKMLVKCRGEYEAGTKEITPAMATKESDTGSFSTRRKVIDSANALICTFAMGVNYALLGLTLIDLERQLSASTKAVSALFVCRGIGIVISCLFSGPLLDYFNHGLLFITCLLMIGVGHVITPFISRIDTAAAVFGLQAVGVGSMSVGCVFLLTKHWREKVGPFMHAYQFVYDIAAFLSPIVQKIFISSVSVDSTTGDYTDIEGNLSTVVNLEATDNQTINYIYIQKNDTGDNYALSVLNITNSPVTYQTDLFGFNIVVAGIFLVLAFIDLVMVIYFRTVRSIWQKPKHASAGEMQDHLKQNIFMRLMSRMRNCSGCNWKRAVRILLLTTLLMFVYSMEGIALVLSVVYHVKGLGWTLKDAVSIASVRGLMCGGSRFLMIFLSRFIVPRTQIYINCFLCTALLMATTFCIFFAPSAIWILLLLSGIPMATLFGAALTWASEQVHMTGIVSALFTLPYAGGLIIGPSMASYYLDVYGPSCYVLQMMLYILISDIMVILILVFNYIWPLEKVSIYSREEVAKEAVPFGKEPSKSTI